MKYLAGDYDIAVIGGGHAGCEAALAAARMGMKTLMFSISLEVVANMPCNPNIGGTSKGHLVREIDALGGEMGKNIDKTFIQSRMLNKSKGPAVYSLRAQADRKKYQREMKKTLEMQENLFVKQAEIVDIIVENGEVKGVETNIGAIYNVKAVILATGTYLKGKIFIGEVNYESGPDGVFPANKLQTIVIVNKIVDGANNTCFAGNVRNRNANVYNSVGAFFANLFGFKFCGPVGFGSGDASEANSQNADCHERAQSFFKHMKSSISLNTSIRRLYFATFFSLISSMDFVTEWVIGFHPTFLKSATNPIGIYVTI